VNTTNDLVNAYLCNPSEDNFRLAKMKVTSLIKKSQENFEGSEAFRKLQSCLKLVERAEELWRQKQRENEEFQQDSNCNGSIDSLFGGCDN